MELKPCPFCGSSSVFLERIAFTKSDEYYYTKCHNCGAQGCGFFNLPICMSYYEKDEAEEIVSEKWNERHN